MTNSAVTINKTKRKVEPTLFPGYQLNRKIDTLQYGACVIGRVFEKITERVLGGHCQTTDSTAALCPDVSGVNLIAESKAFRGNGTLLIKHDQLENYEAQTEFKTVLYLIWAYQHPKPVGDPQRTLEGQVVRNVVGTVEDCYTFDISIIAKLRQFENNIDGVGFRYCRMWFKEQGVVHRSFLTLKRRVLEEARQRPTKFLSDLGLFVPDYEWSECRRRITFIYEQSKFTTRTFRLFTLKKKLSEVPF